MKLKWQELKVCCKERESNGDMVTVSTLFVRVFIFLYFQFHLDNGMNLYYNCIKIINTVKTHHTVHTENVQNGCGV